MKITTNIAGNATDIEVLNNIKSCNIIKSEIIEDEYYSITIEISDIEELIEKLLSRIEN